MKYAALCTTNCCTFLSLIHQAPDQLRCDSQTSLMLRSAANIGLGFAFRNTYSPVGLKRQSIAVHDRINALVIAIHCCCTDFDNSTGINSACKSNRQLHWLAPNFGRIDWPSNYIATNVFVPVIYSCMLTKARLKAKLNRLGSKWDFVTNWVCTPPYTGLKISEDWDWANSMTCSGWLLTRVAGIVTPIWFALLNCRGFSLWNWYACQELTQWAGQACKARSQRAHCIIESNFL